VERRPEKKTIVEEESAMTDPITETVDRLIAASQIDLKEWKYREGLEPIALAPDFDDADWTVDTAIGKPRGKGQVMGWFRRSVEIPERVAGFPIAGSQATLLTNVDDYGEVWVDGALRAPVPGLNVDARALLSEQVQPGDRFQIAILAINGPVGRPIGGIFVRYTRVQFSGLESVRTAAESLIGALHRTARLARRDDPADAALIETIHQAIGEIDWPAADRGEKAAFIASLHAAQRKLP
jgi:hypothetical protein